MAKYVNAGDSIECNRSRVAVRKISQNPIVLKIEGVDGRLYKYKSAIRSIVTITDELNPKIHLVCETSYLTLNDELDAEVMEIYTKTRMSFSLISNFSHVHTIQGDEVNAFTYAKIVIPWRLFLERPPIGIQENRA